MLLKNINRFLSKIGLSGATGVVLLSASTAICLSLSLPMRREIATLNDETRQIESQLAQPASAASAQDVRKKLDDFIGSLPRHDAQNDVLNRLHELALSHHLSLKNSEYRTEQNKTGAIGRLRVTIKTEGEYADLRGFLREIPRAAPALAVAQLSLSRQKISDTRLDTVVEFVLFYSQDDVKLLNR